jgi:hypothetical protein
VDASVIYRLSPKSHNREDLLTPRATITGPDPRPVPTRQNL